MRRPELALLVLAVALLLPACGHKETSSAIPASPLFTGKEAKRKIKLTFPARQQPGFVAVDREIYATASLVNQAKQVVLALLAGPLASEAAAAPCFGADASYLEVYLDGKGLAVVDLPASTVAGLPGGTSAEVATLFCLVRTLSANIPQVGRVQVLIDGQVPESLRGHVDLQDPLNLADF
jgi:hypothetical protein